MIRQTIVTSSALLRLDLAPLDLPRALVLGIKLMQVGLAPAAQGVTNRQGIRNIGTAVLILDPLPALVLPLKRCGITSTNLFLPLSSRSSNS